MILLKKISIEAERIKVVKHLPKPKLVRNIPIFLGFANFYQRFIQGFNKIVVLLTAMLKTTKSFDKLVSGKNIGSRSASSINDNSRLTFQRNNGNNEVNEFGVDKNNIEHAKKSQKSKSKKMFESQNLAKLGKKLLKSGNLTNFGAIEAGLKF